MNIKTKNILAAIISFIPRNSVRVFLYRYFFGYSISSGARIGLGTRIIVEDANIGSAYIGMFNNFIGPMKLEINNGARISRSNIFYCADWAVGPGFTDSDYLRRCLIASDCLITEQHYVDCTGGFELRRGSWIAGRGSQFWTHGASVLDRSVLIGEDCYVGSSVCFAPGVILGDKVLVGLGSVVTKKFDKNSLFIGGNPAEIIRENYPGRKASQANLT